MAMFAWDDSCSVNIPEIDRQHQYLFALVNHLHETMLCGQGRIIVSEILDELTGYAKAHFASEGSYMRAVAFSGLERHEGEHVAFIHKLEAFRLRYTEGAADLTLEIMTFLEQWLKYHVQSADREFASVTPLPPLTVRKAADDRRGLGKR